MKMDMNGNRTRQRRHGFTLLEIIIVIIIISILASLAMPRYSKTVEYARGLEALIQIGTIRQSLNRYYLPKQTYVGATLNNLDVENPMTDIMAHFTYTIFISSPVAFTVVATRNTFDGGDNSSMMTIDQDGIKSGTGIYSGVR